jgi:hypothetical protein
MNTQTAIEYRCHRTQGQAGVRGQGEVTDRQEGSGKGNGTQVEEDGLANRPSRFGVCFSRPHFCARLSRPGRCSCKSGRSDYARPPDGLGDAKNSLLGIESMK